MENKSANRLYKSLTSLAERVFAIIAILSVKILFAIKGELKNALELKPTINN